MSEIGFFDFIPFKTSWGPQKTAFRSRGLPFLSFSVIPSDFLRGGFLGVLPSPAVTRLGTTWRTFKGFRDPHIDFTHPHFGSVFNFVFSGAPRRRPEGPKRAPRMAQEGSKRAPRRLLGPPEGPKRAPRGPQEGPKRAPGSLTSNTN